MEKTKKTETWIIKTVTKSVEDKWGQRVRELMGTEIYEAFLNSALVYLVDAQDESIAAETRLLVLTIGRQQIIDVIYGED